MKPFDLLKTLNGDLLITKNKKYKYLYIVDVDIEEKRLDIQYFNVNKEKPDKTGYELLHYDYFGKLLDSNNEEFNLFMQEDSDLLDDFIKEIEDHKKEIKILEDKILNIKTCKDLQNETV